MQLISVDIGNSSTRISLEQSQSGDRWSTIQVLPNSEDVHFQLTDLPAFWAVCSVNQKRLAELKNWIGRYRTRDHFHVIQETDISLKSNVESREQVGRDRLVAASMAIRMNDRKGPVIVIDAGTAVTVDFVDDNKRFQGGTIFPGAESTLRNLSESTDQLPDLSDREFLELLGDLRKPSVGKSTHQAILNGVYQSQVGGIRHIVQGFKARCDSHVNVYATGGGIADLQSGLPQDWNYVPDLVLRGAQRLGRKLMAVNGV